MKFLIDEPLPPAMAGWLVAHGHDAVHVMDLGFRGRPDEFLQSYAQLHGLVIATKDEDHATIRERFGAVQVLWIRIGNAVNRVLLARLGEVWPDVEAALMRGEPVVKVDPSSPPPP